MAPKSVTSLALGLATGISAADLAKPALTPDATKGLPSSSLPSPLREAARDAKSITPILLGTGIPDVAVVSAAGGTIPLRQLADGKPTLLLFYRGGWCPFCNIQLSQLGRIEPELVELGYQILAISPDHPRSFPKDPENAERRHTVLSDHSTQAARGFGIAYKVDDQTVGAYKKHGIDLESASGETHHVLPVPAVFLLDASSVVQFSYVHPDYKMRVDPDLLLAAARSVLRNKPLERGK